MLCTTRYVSVVGVAVLVCVCVCECYFDMQHADLKLESLSGAELLFKRVT